MAKPPTPAERASGAAAVLVLNTWIAIPLVWSAVSADSYMLRFLAWSAALLIFISTVVAVGIRAHGTTAA